MKKGILVLLVMGLVNSLQAQIFQSNFQDWAPMDSFPTDFNGPHTNLSLNNVTKVTAGAVYGDFACQLANETESGKRFTTQPQSVTAGESYEVTFWVRGEGEVAVRLWADEYVGGVTYTTINSADWTEQAQTVTANIDYDEAEFMFYVRNTTGDHIQIDSVSIGATTLTETAIYDIQYSTLVGGGSPMIGQTVETGGIVTAVMSDTSGYFIQNGSGPWSGIYVYDTENMTQIGDSVTFSATVDEFYDVTELKNPVNFTIVSSGNTVITTEISTQEVNTEEYEGVLLQLINATCETAPNNYNEWTANDNSGATTIDDRIYFYEPTVGVSYDITGVSHYSYGSFMVYPRMMSDVVVHTVGVSELMPESMAIYPNPTAGKVTIEGTGQLKVYNTAGQLVQTLRLNGKAVMLEQLPAGVYSCVLLDEAGQLQAREKLVIK